MRKYQGAMMMSNVERAYLDGYDAYLYETFGGVGRPLTPPPESMSKQLIYEDADLYDAWLKGWKQAAEKSKLRRSVCSTTFSHVAAPIPIGSPTLNELLLDKPDGVF